MHDDDAAHACLGDSGGCHRRLGWSITARWLRRAARRRTPLLTSVLSPPAGGPARPLCCHLKFHPSCPGVELWSLPPKLVTFAFLNFAAAASKWRTTVLVLPLQVVHKTLETSGLRKNLSLSTPLPIRKSSGFDSLERNAAAIHCAFLFARQQSFSVWFESNKGTRMFGWTKRKPSSCTRSHWLFQVFIRELISNASDALEKLRYLQARGDQVEQGDTPLEIHIRTDEDKKTFTIQVTPPENRPKPTNTLAFWFPKKTLVAVRSDKGWTGQVERFQSPPCCSLGGKMFREKWAPHPSPPTGQQLDDCGIFSFNTLCLCFPCSAPWLFSVQHQNFFRIVVLGDSVTEMQILKFSSWNLQLWYDQQLNCWHWTFCFRIRGSAWRRKRWSVTWEPSPDRAPR